MTSWLFVTRSTAAARASIAAAMAAIILGACGGSQGSGTGSRSSAGSGSHASATTTHAHTTPAGTHPGRLSEAALGAQVFAHAGCGGCHTLAAAHSSGSVGPNLDTLKPSYAAVLQQVENGGGPMPSFKGDLSAAQIRAVSHYVADATR